MHLHASTWRLVLQNLFSYLLKTLPCKIYTGKVPFNDLDNDLTVIYHVTLRGKRPIRPSQGEGREISDDLWMIIEMSWENVPERRPNATDVLDLMKEWDFGMEYFEI